MNIVDTVCAALGESAKQDQISIPGLTGRGLRKAEVGLCPLAPIMTTFPMLKTLHR